MTCVTLAMDSSRKLNAWHRILRKVLFVVARTICVLSFNPSMSDSEAGSDDNEHSFDTSRDSSDETSSLTPQRALSCHHPSLTRSGSNANWVKLSCKMCGYKFEDRMRTPEEKAAAGRKRWSDTPLYRLHTDSL